MQQIAAVESMQESLRQQHSAHLASYKAIEPRLEYVTDRCH